MVQGNTWYDWLINFYSAVALIEYGQLTGRDQVKSCGQDRNFLVWLITRIGIAVLAVIWPITELISLGMMLGKND